MSTYEPDGSIAKEIFLIGGVGPKSRELADNIAGMGGGRRDMVHGCAKKGTGENLAMPLTLLEVSLGEVCNFVSTT